VCIVRIAGAICQLLTYSNSSTGLLEATLIIDAIGLSPLLLATLGMLSRLYDWINARSTSMMGVKQFRLVQLIITLGLILSIAGGASGSTDANGNIKIATTSKVGVILYILGFIAIVLVWLLALSSLSVVPSKERRLSLAVLIALPFVAVRLLYSTLAIFLHDNHFGLIHGSVIIHVCMAVLEEMIVVFIYILLGWTLDKVHPDEQGPIASRPWKGRKNGSQQAGYLPQPTAAHKNSHDIERNHPSYANGI
jgi:hypothetical protein